MAVYSGDRLEWLQSAVESILSQTHSSVCLSVIIDGPVNDKISKYLEETASTDSRMRLFALDDNRGLSACMNVIIEAELARQSPAPYFCRMDADDISFSERIEKQVSYLREHLDVCVLGSGLVEVNELGRIVGSRELPANHEDIIRMLPKRCSLNHPTVMIRTSVFEKGYRYDESLRNTQDYFLWVDLAAAGFRFANLKEKMLSFRRVNDFYKRRGLNKTLNEFKARFYAMRKLKHFTIGSVFYALSVLTLRIMPSKIIKLAYKLDRHLLKKRSER
nr:glycosyltransferase [Aestuariibacter salexigens]